MPIPRPWLPWAVLGAVATASGLLIGSSIAREASPRAAAPAFSVDDDPTAAALRAVQVLGSPAMYDAGLRDQELAATVEPTLASRLATGLALAAEGLGLDERGVSDSGELVARLVPAGYRLLETSEDRAVVAVWSVGLLGLAGPTSPHPVQATWSTDTLTLQLIGGQWVVTDVAHRNGPAPVGTSQVPAPPTVLLQHVNDHEIEQ